VKRFFVLFFLISNLSVFAQNDLANEGRTASPVSELPKGIISGQVFTTDHQPAASVTIYLKGTQKLTTTNEEGYFRFKNVKEGRYTLEISMVGLKNQERSVEVRNDAVVNLTVVLEEDSKQLSDVVVTARKSLNEKITSISKMPVQPRDLPQSITVIDKSILEKQQVQTMSDALQNVNGVYIMGTTGGFQEEIAARGYAFTSSNTFKNGSRFNNGVKTEFSSVERIEVLKGGNAILYGNVGAGGILNIVTKKPKFEYGGEISFRAGSYSLFKPAFDFYGPFNQSKKAAWRINASYEHAGSFRDVVSSERLYINPSFLFKAGKKTEILLEGDFLKDNRTPDYGVGAINYKLVDIPRSRFLNTSWAYNNTLQSSGTVTVNSQLNEKINIRSVVSYQGYDNNLFSALRPASVSISSNGTWTRGLQKTRTAEDYFFTSIDLNAKFRTSSIEHVFLLGADADLYKTQATAFAAYANPVIGNRNIYDTINIFDPTTINTRNDIPSLARDRITSSPVSRFGIYVQDLISILPNVKLLAGVRYSYQNNQRATVDTVSKNRKGYIAGYTGDAYSPRFGLVYQPTRSVSIFTSYTNSFTVNTGVDVHNHSLKPSVIDQFEAGIKNDLFKGQLTANITVYRIINSNLAQTALFLSDGVTVNNNSNIRELTGETTSKGVEVDIMSKPIHGFNFIGGYSYNDMRYTSVNGNTVNGNKMGDRLRYNPAHTANASVYYSFKKESYLHGFFLGAGAFYVGDRLAGRNPTNTPGNTNQLMPLPDYVTADIHGGYTLNGFAIRLKLSNVFNQLSYNAHDDNSINPIAPRQFVATVSYKF